jgi:hypothetical protein
MAAQNARLVVGYCAKKAELRRLQEALASERARWEVRYRAETERHIQCQSLLHNDTTQPLAECRQVFCLWYLGASGGVFAVALT